MELFHRMDRWIWLLLLDSASNRLDLLRLDSEFGIIDEFNPWPGWQELSDCFYFHVCARLSRYRWSGVHDVYACWFKSNPRCTGTVLCSSCSAAVFGISQPFLGKENKPAFLQMDSELSCRCSIPQRFGHLICISRALWNNVLSNRTLLPASLSGFSK